MASYSPVEIAGHRWALVAEIDVAEAFAVVSKIQWLMATVAVVRAAGIVLVALFMTRTITKPIIRGVDFAKTMAGGDFSQKLAIDQEDEVGILAKAFNEMTRSIGAMFKEIISGVNTMNTSSSELTDIAHLMTDGAEKTSAKSNSVSAIRWKGFKIHRKAWCRPSSRFLR